MSSPEAFVANGSQKVHQVNSALPNFDCSLRKGFLQNSHNKPGSNLFCTVSFDNDKRTWVTVSKCQHSDCFSSFQASA